MGYKPTTIKEFEEPGSSGLKGWGGWIQEAYRTELQWPGVESEYSRLWRSDAELTIQRVIHGSWAASLSPRFELPVASDVGEDAQPTDDDQRALDFANQCLEDIEGGITQWLVSAITKVPYYGWGLWVAPPGVRNETWTPPDNDPWRSKYNDNLIGYRRLSFRRYSSFYSWEFDDNERLRGMRQLGMSGGIASIPLDKSLHITFGDNDNPEGLALLESMWRLAKLKQGFEVVFGIGSEHTAGHLSVTVDSEQSFDVENIKKAARAMMTAQEGNYAAWPAGVSGALIDVPFAAGTTILEAIRHYTILKLALLGMQWIAFSTISGVGSMASMKDASQIAITVFNTMVAGFVSQADQQIGKRLFEFDVNKAAFPGMTRRPVLVVDKLRKEIDLTELSSFATAMYSIMPLGTDDIIALRKASEILPETLPVEESADGESIAETPEQITPDEAEKIVDEVMDTVKQHRPDLLAKLNNEIGGDCANC